MCIMVIVNLIHANKKGGDTLTDSEKLKAKIRDSGYRIRFLAEQLGISYQALYNKVDNKTQFLASEIMRFSDLLNLTPEERDDIFFTAK